MRTSIFILVIGLCYNFSAAQNPEWINCLSGEQVHQVAESDSLLWIATSGGLVSQDKLTGNNSYYNCANSQLVTNEIDQVLIDASGVVWIPNLGVTSIEGTTWTNYPEVSGRMTLDENGNILVANPSGVYRWSGSGFSHLPMETNYLNTSDVIVDKSNGDIYISLFTFGMFQINVFSSGVWSVFNHQNSDLPWESPSSNKFSFDSENRLWLATYFGPYRYEKSEWKYVGDELNMNLVRTADVAHDELGNTYLFSSFSGQPILKVSQNNVVDSITIPTVYELYSRASFIEASGDGESIKIGSLVYGFHEYKDGSWTKIRSSQNQLTNNNFQANKDASDDIYISNGATYMKSQIFRYEDQSWQDLSDVYPFSQQPEYGAQYNLRFFGDSDSDSYLHYNSSSYQEMDGEWMPTMYPDIDPEADESNAEYFVDVYGHSWLFNKWNANIYFEENGDWKIFFPGEHGATSGNVTSYFNHPQTNDLWLSSNTGLSVYEYDDMTWTRYDFRDYGLDLRSADLRLADEGIIWGYNAYQFFRMTDLMDLEILYETRTEDSVRENITTMLVEDGKVWLGAILGIYMYEDSTMQKFDSSNSGISSGRVNAIVRDKNDNLWISAYGGLSIYNPDGVTDDLVEKTGLSAVTELEQNVFKLFPNPSSGQFSIDFATEGSYEIYIYDLYGRVIHREENAYKNHNVNLEEIGLFYVKVRAQGETEYHSQLIIIN